MIPSLKDIQQQAKSASVIPVFKKISADLDTPVSVFLKLASKKKTAFLLESIEGGEKLARYSFIGFDPFMTIEVEKPTDEQRTADYKAMRPIVVTRGKLRERLDAYPMEYINSVLKQFKPARVENIPRFSGGAVGYFTYDTARWFEEIPDCNKDILEFPDCRLNFFREVVVFDHLKQEVILIANVLTRFGNESLSKKYKSAVEWIAKSELAIQNDRIVSNIAPVTKSRSRVKSHTSQTEFEESVKAAKRHIKEGDIFQVVLSQRWTVTTASSDIDIYRKLRRINPSPYMFLLRHGDDSIIGSSPEMLARIEHGTVETRPIAGTRPRGKTQAEDDKLAESLYTDPKELAEHTMLLDLGRNDIGKVSKNGAVTISRQMEIEKYSHVIHLVSAVRGELSKDVTPLSAMFSCFPAGTVSGAPKIRAMQIIDELETLRRGPYAGAIAYIDFWGNVDSCIAIRTLVKQGKTVHLQAGAGIVADSKPRNEFLETKHKAEALLQAVAGM